ncbi:MAG TPA: wax ester/triacylglycerol synthase family O-acyltransferase [Thermoleophilaceae bacterium]|nr:wax ester/triacylglycerol synthase family O-acyltransferase [Thermoleophilaceae bacterium]
MPPIEHLTSEDAEILRLEAGPVAGHMLKVVVAERPAREDDLLSALRERVAAGVGHTPRCTQRLVPTPLGVAPPAWVPDPDFDVGRHVRRAPVARADWERFRAAVASSMAERLNRRHPLWSVELIEGLEDDRVAYILKIHHCMADGLAAMRLAAELLWDSSPEAGIAPNGERPSPGPMPGRARLLASGVSERARDLRATGAGAARTVVSPPRRRAEEAELARIPGTVRRELRAGHGHSPLDTPIHGNREVAFVSWPLDDLKRAGHAHGATVNDVLLAAVAGGLRGWLLGRGEGVPDARVKVPVSMHHGDEGHATLGNRDSFFFVDLPLGERDPVRRLEAVRGETAERKRAHDAETLYVLFNDLAHVSKRAYRRANAIAGRPGVFSLCVSNVPGPRERLYVLGGRIEEVHSLAEIGDRHGLRVSAVSYCGSVSLGLCADPAAIHDLDSLAAALEESLAELG